MQREEKPETLLLSGFNVAKGVVTTIRAVSICPHILLLSFSPICQLLLVMTDVGNVAWLQLQPFRSVALGATMTVMRRGSILQNWIPSSWLSHISQVWGWGERGERKGALGSWDGSLRRIEA